MKLQDIKEQIANMTEAEKIELKNILEQDIKISEQSDIEGFEQSEIESYERAIEDFEYNVNYRHTSCVGISAKIMSINKGKVYADVVVTEEDTEHSYNDCSYLKEVLDKYKVKK